MNQSDSCALQGKLRILIPLYLKLTYRLPNTTQVGLIYPQLAKYMRFNRLY